MAADPKERKAGIFRSEDMHLYKLVMSKDNEYQVASLLGKNGTSHFIDMNEADQSFGLAHIDIVKRGEESEKKLNRVINQCNLFKIDLKHAKTVTELDELERGVAAHRQIGRSTLFENIEKHVEEIQAFTNEQHERLKGMIDESNHLIEYLTVLKNA